jgi:aminoglycoside phosphotransferase family enzyme
MDNNLEMDKMLARDEVTEKHIDKLAEKVAKFHKKVRMLKNAFATLKFQERFADIQIDKYFSVRKIRSRMGNQNK